MEPLLWSLDVLLGLLSQMLVLGPLPSVPVAENQRLGSLPRSVLDEIAVLLSISGPNLDLI